MINQMQFSLLENILTVLFLIAVVLWICYLCLRRRSKGAFRTQTMEKSGRSFEKYKHRYLPDGLPPEHQCGDGTGRNRSGASDYFSGHGASEKMRHHGNR